MPHGESVEEVMLKVRCGFYSILFHEIQLELEMHRSSQLSFLMYCSPRGSSVPQHNAKFQGSGNRRRWSNLRVCFFSCFMADGLPQSPALPVITFSFGVSAQVVVFLRTIFYAAKCFVFDPCAARLHTARERLAGVTGYRCVEVCNLLCVCVCVCVVQVSVMG